ncbi:cation-transporting P-type ATPase [Streptomyces lavendulae]|uniref:P-type ATPase n=1 Tax=Streptomyces lavendulae TaxID=1914 RepID=UPI0033DB3004
MTTSAAQQASAPAGPHRGLTEAEAARRLAEHGRNEVAAAKTVPLYARVLAQLRDALILVSLGAVVLTLSIGDHADTVVIALVIAVNSAVGVAQEVRADHAVAAQSALSAPNARVLRDSAPGELPAAEVVPGDVLLLGEGGIVATDAELAEASALLVDESMLTGESVAVDKDEGDRLSAGTVVVRGRGVAMVTVLAADKTGTLTEGRMAVRHVWTPRVTFDFFGVGYEPEGDVRVEGRRPTADELDPVRELLTVTALCNDAGLRPPRESSDEEHRWTAVGDPMEAALLAAAAKAGCADQSDKETRR